VNVSTLIVFLMFLGATLAITAWASRRSSTRSDFYVAGGQISGVQNGIAFAGDYMSAATLLGISGLYFTVGFDGFVYNLLGIVGWPVLLFLLAERLRVLGRFTLTDVLVWRLEHRSVRLFAGCANLTVLVFYMVSQMVGAGALANLLLGLDYTTSTIVVGSLMTVYVIFGGMVATTWVQIIKALLLLLAAAVLAILVLATFDFELSRIFATAQENHPLGAAIMGPSSALGVGATISLTLTLMFGPAGLPHIMMRFFTVPNVQEARKSAAIATAIVAGFSLMMIVIGYGTIAILSGDPRYTDGPSSLIGGSNMASLYLADALGGSVFLGIISAVALATILAVVSGLTIAAAATVSHDLVRALFPRLEIDERRELKLSRISVCAFAVTGIALSIVFRDQNITFLSVIAFSIAASATFPVLMLSLFWKRLTVTGVLCGGFAGLISAIVLLVLGPSVWEAVFGFTEPPFPYQYPTIVSMPLAFLVAIFTSMVTHQGRFHLEPSARSAQQGA
jgi:cation/acetate symporter